MKLNELREEFQLQEELTKLEAEEKAMDEIPDVPEKGSRFDHG